MPKLPTVYTDVLRRTAGTIFPIEIDFAIAGVMEGRLLHQSRRTGSA
jgi:hypothetical protein